MRRILLVILPFLEITLLAVACATPAPDSSIISPRATTHALVIGISQYRDGTTVEYAERSAAAFRAMLGRLGLAAENIHCLFGPSATRDNIRQALSSFAQTGPNDNIVIYFAGRSFASSDSVNPDGGIVANEDAPVFPNISKATTFSGVGSGISWSGIRLLLNASPAAGAIMFFDVPAGGLLAGPIILDEGQPRSRMIVTAGDRRDSVSWDPLSGVTTFVRCITSGLEEGAADVDGDGEVTGSELTEFLAAEVPHQSGYKQRVIARSFLPQGAEFRFGAPFKPSSEGSGILVVRGAPSGSIVAVGGRRIKSTGNDTLALLTGTHRVAVYDQAGTMQCSVQIARDTATLLDVRLQSLPGNLQVQCLPESATVWLDGQVIGITRLTGVKVPCGIHELVLRRRGFVNDRSLIFIRAGAGVQIHRWLRKPLVLDVSSEPVGAMLKIDQRVVGSTPVFLDGIAEGERYVELSAPDFHAARFIVQGYWPDTVRVAKRLTSMFGIVKLRSSTHSMIASLDSLVIPSPIPDSCKILTGRHTLTLYDPATGVAVEGTFELAAAARLEAIADFNHFSIPKCMRGLLIPGVNQITDRQVLPGIGMLLANAGSLVFTLTARSTLRDKRSTYESARTEYLVAANERDAIRTRSTMSAAYDDLSRATRTRNIAVSCLAGVFVFSAVHTILFHSRESSLTISPSRSIAVTPTVDVVTQRLRYGIAVSF